MHSSAKWVNTSGAIQSNFWPQKIQKISLFFNGKSEIFSSYFGYKCGVVWLVLVIGSLFRRDNFGLDGNTVQVRDLINRKKLWDYPVIYQAECLKSALHL